MLALSLQWFDWWRRAALLGWGQLDRLTALPDPHGLRERWLADLRRFSAEYTKSPAFLAMMRLNLTMLTHPAVSKATQMMSLSAR
jgi:hypothetical protein